MRVLFHLIAWRTTSKEKQSEQGIFLNISSTIIVDRVKQVQRVREPVGIICLSVKRAKSLVDAYENPSISVHIRRICMTSHAS